MNTVDSEQLTYYMPDSTKYRQHGDSYYKAGRGGYTSGWPQTGTFSMMKQNLHSLTRHKIPLLTKAAQHWGYFDLRWDLGIPTAKA